VRIHPCSIALLLVSAALGAGPEGSRLPLLAVMPMEARQVSADDALILSEALASELQNSGEVRVMERTQMDKILSEQGFQKSGACSGTECAVEVGQLLGIDRMVVGSVGHLGRTYVLVARMVNVSTGEVLRSSTRQAAGEIDQILTSLVPDVAADLTGRSTKPTPPPEVRFQGPPPSDQWTDSVVVSWQATSTRPLAEVRVGLLRPGRDSLLFQQTRKAAGTLAHGDFLVVVPSPRDTGAYLLRLWAKDASGAQGTADFPFRRHVQLVESRSHWGWWLFGGLVLVGGAGGGAWVALHQNNSGSGTSPRSLSVTW
jgi:hypothetical protein